MDLKNLGAIAVGTFLVSLFAFLIALLRGRTGKRRDRVLDALAAGAIAASGVLLTLLAGRALVLVVQGFLRSLSWG